MLDFRTKFVAAGALALSLGLGAVSAGAQEFINVLTGGTSGVYYPLGVALSEIYGKGIE
ncbi:MAG: C4-dicarboxylate ABC transporter, partial [Mesorhizobium sp.]